MNFAETIERHLDAMLMSGVEKLPDLAIALVVIILTWVLARVAVRIVNRATGRTELRENLRQLARTVTRLGVWVLGLLVAATIAIPGLTPASMFASLGIGAVAIGFAFKDIFENFLAGVLIMLRDKMEIGDVIEVSGILGRVERTTLRETHIRQLSGELTILPNSTIFTNAVKIYTDEKVRRNELVIGVSYDADLVQSEAVIRKAVEGLAGVAESPKVDVYAQEFNSSSIDFLVRWWTDTGENDFLGLKSEAMFAIKRALDEADIEIPYPHVTHTFKDAVPVGQQG